MFRLLDMAMMATPCRYMMSSWDKVSAKAAVAQRAFCISPFSYALRTHPSDWSSRYLLCLKVIVHNLFPEGRQSKTHQTKVHFGPWYTNDGDTEQQAEAKMRERNPDAPDKEPQHIHKHVDATTALRTINNMRTEWPQGKYAKLHRSKAKGNTNDGNHQYQ